jgi:hypothetical protein
MIGFYQGKIATCRLGQFSLEKRVNIVFPENCSSTFGIRLQKYLNRGYNIVLPRLNISRITERIEERSDEESDSAFDSDTESKTEFEKHKNVKLASFSFDPDMIERNAISVSSLKVEKEIYQRYDVDYEDPSYFDPCEMAARFIRSQKKFHHFDYATSVVCSNFSGKEVIERSLQPIRASFSKEIWSNSRAGSREDLRHIKERYLEGYNIFRKIVWRESSPGSRLSGAFVPMDIDERTWYGEYYLEKSEEFLEKDNPTDQSNSLVLNCPHCNKRLTIKVKAKDL